MRLLLLLPLLLALAGCAAPAPDPEPAAPARVLRICADPNNLPFSNEELQGFENRLAELLAKEMGATVEYTWWAQRRGFVRNTLRAGKCDVILGVPTSFELAATTAPYYRSSYYFVTRADSGIDIESFDDPDLRTLRVGVHLIGDDGANTPPAHALASRGIIENVKGYTIYGDYREKNPPARLLDAVVAKEVDVACVWGPLAGWYAKESRAAPLRLVPVEPQVDLPFLPEVFDIAIGVRRGDDALRDEIDGILEKRKSEVDAILARYGVPRLDVEEGS